MIKLKSSFIVHPEEARVLLINEHQQISEDKKYETLLFKLVDGVESDDLSDTEFEQIQYFGDRGYLSSVDNPDAASWELLSAPFATVTEQIKHITFNVIAMASKI